MHSHVREKENVKNVSAPPCVIEIVFVGNVRRTVHLVVCVSECVCVCVFALRSVDERLETKSAPCMHVHACVMVFVYALSTST